MEAGSDTSHLTKISDELVFFDSDNILLPMLLIPHHKPSVNTRTDSTCRCYMQHSQPQLFPHYCSLLLLLLPAYVHVQYLVTSKLQRCGVRYDEEVDLSRRACCRRAPGPRRMECRVLLDQRLSQKAHQGPEGVIWIECVLFRHAKTPQKRRKNKQRDLTNSLRFLNLCSCSFNRAQGPSPSRALAPYDSNRCRLYQRGQKLSP
jgi:hypothetical protein